MVWVKLDCPRCKATSSIDAALAGQYAVCPACQARVLVPINAPATSPPQAANAQPHVGAGAGIAGGGPTDLRKTVSGGSSQTWVGGQPLPPAAGLSNGPQPLGPPPNRPPGTAPLARVTASKERPASPAGASNGELPLSPPLAGAPVLPPRAHPLPPAAPPAAAVPYAVQPVRAAVAGPAPPFVSGGTTANMLAGGVPAAPPISGGGGLPVAGSQTPAGTRKVARFIAAEPAQATIQLAADGQLPSLQLVEAGKTETVESKGSSMNPLLVLGAIAASFCMSVMLLISDVGSGEGDQKLKETQHQLETYFAGQQRPLAPYQIHLREAQQAYSRGARKTARGHYRKVLDLLHSEGGDRFHGVTGTPAGDKQLEKLLSIMLGQDGSSDAPVDET